MTSEEQSAWWEETRSRIDTALANLIVGTGRMPSKVTALELCLWASQRRDDPDPRNARCAHCGELLPHKCDLAKP